MYCFTNLTFISLVSSSCKDNYNKVKYKCRSNIVTNTDILPLSVRFSNASNTFLKSIGFGAWIKLPPNDVKWLQRQIRCVRFDVDPTCSKQHVGIKIKKVMMSLSWFSKLFVYLIASVTDNSRYHLKI